jgi:hypothetical protein
MTTIRGTHVEMAVGAGGIRAGRGRGGGGGGRGVGGAQWVSWVSWVSWWCWCVSVGGALGREQGAGRGIPAPGRGPGILWKIDINFI